MDKLMQIMETVGYHQKFYFRKLKNHFELQFNATGEKTIKINFKILVFRILTHISSIIIFTLFLETLFTYFFKVNSFRIWEFSGFLKFSTNLMPCPDPLVELGETANEKDQRAVVLNARGDQARRFPEQME